MSKLYLVGMSGPGSLDNLKELIDPIKTYIDGLCWTLHDSLNTPESSYLESVKGAGDVIHARYCQRHDFGRNHYLWCGPIQDGDWCCQIDDLERLNVAFAAGLRDFVKLLELSGYNMASYYGKPFLFQYHETLEYVGTPHESLRRKDGRMRSIELSHQYPDEKDVRLNVRPEKRDIPQPFYWVQHYMRYMMGPAGSNAALLGLDTYGDPGKLFPPRDAARLAFRAEVRRRGLPLTLTGLNQLFAATLDETLKSYINSEIVLNNYYRYTILGDKTVVHSHDPKDIVKIP